MVQLATGQAATVGKQGKQPLLQGAKVGRVGRCIWLTGGQDIRVLGEAHRNHQVDTGSQGREGGFSKPAGQVQLTGGEDGFLGDHILDGERIGNFGFRHDFQYNALDHLLSEGDNHQVTRL